MTHESCHNGDAMMRRTPRPERENPTGIWAPTGATSDLLSALALRLGLDWTLNGPARPDLLVLTNLGQGDPTALAARCRPRLTVLCLDDRAGREFLAHTTLPCFTYSEGKDEADLTARDLRLRPEGLAFLVATRTALARVTVPADDLYTALAALACAAALEVPLEAAAQAVTGILCAPGKTPPPPGETL